MPKTSPLNRRQWFKSSAAALAGLAIASRARATPAPAVPATGPVRLSLNENPLGPSPAAVSAMRARAADVCRYPMNEGRDLVAMLAAKEGVKPEQIVLGAGSGEILEACGLLLGGPGGEVVCAKPTYGQLTAAMARRGSTLVEVPLNDRKEHDLAAMAAAVSATTQCVYVCNPNNPTGTVVDAAELREFVRTAAATAPVVVDEAYLECSDDFAGRTLVGLVAEGHDVMVLRTFSKIHGLAGQRIGYGITSPARAAKLGPYVIGGPNLLALVGAKANLDDVNYVARTRREIKAGRDAVIAVLEELGRDYAVPHGNFVFFHSGMPIVEFRRRMLAEGVHVGRPFPPFFDWGRISIGTPDEMAAAHAALRAVLG
ncbi:MAG: pyridoxal phosphate-dependent aminotransferase [Cephaloticoccus sp.]